MLEARLGVGCLTVMMKNPPQSGKQLLRALAGRIGINVRDTVDKLTLIDIIEDHLLRLYHRGRLVALVLDEAQDLSSASLEEIRLLWNWEQEGQRLVQIVMIGQAELREKLMEPKWEPLRQRIVLSYHLTNLSRTDASAYIDHRLSIASDGDCAAGFSTEAVEEIYAATDGIPRLINVLCDNALLVGYAKGIQEIDQPIVREVLRDMTCWGLRVSDQPSRAARPD